jgi:hypothetical protein
MIGFDVAVDAAASAAFRWACSGSDEPTDLVSSAARRTLGGVLPPIENGDPGDESTED